jgi:cell division septal protein FtsQ
MSQNSSYRSLQLIKKKKNQRIIKISLFAFLIVVIVFGLSYWSKHESLTVGEIIISENIFLNDGEIIEDIKNILNTKKMGLFTTSNFLLIPRNKIKDIILNNYVAVSEINLKVQKRNTLYIEIVEHETAALWCGFSEKNKTNCLLLNKFGLVFAKENLSTERLMKTYGFFQEQELNEIIGQNYLTPEVFKKSLSFTKNLNQLNINADFMDISDDNLIIHTVRGPYLLLDKKSDFAEVLNNLKIVIETEEINTAQFRNLEYIDLRFGNKVYYKIK